jgi:hypothetical protein
LNVTAKTVNTELKGSGDIILRQSRHAQHQQIRQRRCTRVESSRAKALSPHPVPAIVKSTPVRPQEPGSGDVYYTSNPPQLSVSTGSGKISKIITSVGWRRIAMKFTVALLILLLVAPTLAQPQQPVSVSIVQLIANPKAYHAKFVRVVGFVSVRFEGTAVYLHEEDYKRGISKMDYGST